MFCDIPLPPCLTRGTLVSSGQFLTVHTFTLVLKEFSGI